jgi:acyl carrier protein
VSGPELVAKLIAVVARIAGRERTPADAGPDTPLVGGGFFLTSVGILEVIVACEAAFDVSFDSELDLSRETLATIGTLAGAIERKLAA